jgi:hypothetical protein
MVHEPSSDNGFARTNEAVRKVLPMAQIDQSDTRENEDDRDSPCYRCVRKGNIGHELPATSQARCLLFSCLACALCYTAGRVMSFPDSLHRCRAVTRFLQRRCESTLGSHQLCGYLTHKRNVQHATRCPWCCSILRLQPVSVIVPSCMVRDCR